MVQHQKFAWCIERIQEMIPITAEELKLDEFKFLTSSENMVIYSSQVRYVCFMLSSQMFFFHHQFIKLIHLQKFQTTQVTLHFLLVFVVHGMLLLINQFNKLVMFNKLNCCLCVLQTCHLYATTTRCNRRSFRN